MASQVPEKMMVNRRSTSLLTVAEMPEMTDLRGKFFRLDVSVDIFQ